MIVSKQSIALAKKIVDLYIETSSIGRLVMDKFAYWNSKKATSSNLASGRLSFLKHVRNVDTIPHQKHALYLNWIRTLEFFRLSTVIS